jgi:hypothetical protein
LCERIPVAEKRRERMRKTNYNKKKERNAQHVCYIGGKEEGDD